MKESNKNRIKKKKNPFKANEQYKTIEQSKQSKTSA